MAKKIIIIEDDPDILDIMTFILIDQGYEVNACTRSSVLDTVDDNYPDLILLDNRLPEGLGVEICQQYKAQWQEQEKCICPVIIISADHELGHLAEKYGADAFLEKPFDVEDFVAIVQRFIKV